MIEYILDQCRHASEKLQRAYRVLEDSDNDDSWQGKHETLKSSVLEVSGHLKMLSKTVPDPLGGGHSLRSDEDYETLRGCLVVYLKSIGLNVTDIQFNDEELEDGTVEDIEICIDVDLTGTRFNPAGFSETQHKPLSTPDIRDARTRRDNLKDELLKAVSIAVLWNTYGDDRQRIGSIMEQLWVNTDTRQSSLPGLEVKEEK